MSGRMLRRCGLMAVLLTTAAPLLAQSVSPPATPSQRPRPDFQPVGGRVGSFMIYPEIDAVLAYDDNVLADSTGKRGDVVASLRPSVKIESLWKRHRLEASAYAEQSFHGRFKTENELEAGARLAGHLDVDRYSRIEASVSFDALAEDRTSITATRSALEPVRFTRAAARLAYTRTVSDLSLSGQVQASRLQFKDAVAADGTAIDQDFRNTTYVSGSARVSYRVGPGISLLGRVEVDKLDSAENPGAVVPFDRDSTGLKVEAGVYLELSRLLFGEVRAGYLRRWNADPRIAGAKGLSFGAALTWLPTSLTSVRLTADRSVEEGGSLVTAGNLRSRAALTVEHELLRSLVIAAEGRVARIDPQGPLPRTWEYGAELRATWYVNRNLRLLGRVEHFRRNAAAPFPGLSRNRAMVTARLVF